MHFSNSCLTYLHREREQNEWKHIKQKNANLSHKVALISGGISASIYLHDVIWVFSKGKKNKKRRIYQ